MSLFGQYEEFTKTSTTRPGLLVLPYLNNKYYDSERISIDKIKKISHFRSLSNLPISDLDVSNMTNIPKIIDLDNVNTQLPLHDQDILIKLEISNGSLFVISDLLFLSVTSRSFNVHLKRKVSIYLTPEINVIWDRKNYLNCLIGYALTMKTDDLGILKSVIDDDSSIIEHVNKTVQYEYRRLFGKDLINGGKEMVYKLAFLTIESEKERSEFVRIRLRTNIQSDDSYDIGEIESLEPILNLRPVKDYLLSNEIISDIICYRLVSKLYSNDRIIPILNEKDIRIWNEFSSENEWETIVRQSVGKILQNEQPIEYDLLCSIIAKREYHWLEDELLNIYRNSNYQKKLNFNQLIRLNKIKTKTVIFFIDGLSLIDILDTKYSNSFKANFTLDYGLSPLPSITKLFTKYFEEDYQLKYTDLLKFKSHYKSVLDNFLSQENETLIIYDSEIDKKTRSKDSAVNEFANAKLRELSEIVEILQDSFYWRAFDYIIISDHGLIETSEIEQIGDDFTKESSAGAHHRYVELRENGDKEILRHKYGEKFHIFYPEEGNIGNQLNTIWAAPKLPVGVGVTSSKHRSWHGGLSTRECLVPVYYKRE